MTKSTEMTVRPDAKGRITLGHMAKDVSSFRVHQEEGGRIVLEPFVEIPAREHWIFKNPEALAMLEQGLRESAEGKTVRMPSFAQYADDED
ncbi:MAG: hypothetical protein ABI230_13235 [Aestuariivirga sp.]